VGNWHDNSVSRIDPHTNPVVGRRSLPGVQQVDAGQQVSGAAAPGRRHRGDHLVQGRTGGAAEGHGATAGHRQRDRGRLGGVKFNGGRVWPGSML
jgi:hypothetical protein